MQFQIMIQLYLIVLSKKVNLIRFTFFGTLMQLTVVDIRRNPPQSADV